MPQITTEQALQIPQQVKRHEAQTGQRQETAPSPNANRAPASSLGDDAVTLSLEESNKTLKKLPVEDFKQSLGSDNSYIKETLKVKLAEFNLNANTPLSISKDVFGNLEIKGPLLQGDIDRITADLEKSPAFKNAFGRVSQHQPTLDYVDNVVKISEAYGVSNTLFNSLVSEDKQFNGLTDIAHRYQTLRTNNSENLAQNTEPRERFQLVIN